MTESSPEKRIIKVRRVLATTSFVTWPDSYPGMTFEEALVYERDTAVGVAIECLMDASDYDSLATEANAGDKGYKEFVNGT